MSPRPVPADLLPWALSYLEAATEEPLPVFYVVAGDASNRRYFRLERSGASYIVVEAPPETEKNEAFLAVRQVLADAGVKVPAAYAVDLPRGYLILEDLGDQLLLPALNPDSVEEHYSQAFAVLRQMAGLGIDDLDLPTYDNALLEEELSRFQTWFVEALLEYLPDAEECRVLQAVLDRLVENALEQPQVLVHRDFHSRNLMLQADGQLGVIDFQDAVIGPVTYDLVSLLRDCYIRWPADEVSAWALAYRDSLQAAGLLPPVEDRQFLRWLDLMGLQRHIKVLGTFARLYLRDGKSSYLEDLPLVVTYVREICGRYASQEPAFARFDQWFEQRLVPLINQQDWSSDA